MLETRAIVVQVEEGHALVRADQASGCEQCSWKGCGTGKLSRLFCSKPRQFQADNPINAKVGDEVIISVADGAILRGIGLIYLLPLTLMVAGAMLGNFWGPRQSDGFAALGAALGLAGGFIFARWISVRQVWSYSRPYVARPWEEQN